MLIMVTVHEIQQSNKGKAALTGIVTESKLFAFLLSDSFINTSTLSRSLITDSFPGKNAVWHVVQNY